MPVRHGEGRVLFASEEDKKKMEDGKQIVFRYSNLAGEKAEEYPANPNGSTDAIAGVCNPAGNVMGMMPHPECHLYYTQSPNWTKNPPPHKKKPAGIIGHLVSGLGLVAAPPPPADDGNCVQLFTNLVEAAKKF
jgi:phosphoribosylformylglycinamidine synthase